MYDATAYSTGCWFLLPLCLLVAIGVIYFICRNRSGGVTLCGCGGEKTSSDSEKRENSPPSSES